MRDQDSRRPRLCVCTGAWFDGLPGCLPYKVTGILPGRLPRSGWFPFVWQKSAPCTWTLTWEWALAWETMVHTQSVVGKGSL